MAVGERRGRRSAQGDMGGVWQALNLYYDKLPLSRLGTVYYKSRSGGGRMGNCTWGTDGRWSHYLQASADTCSLLFRTVD